MRQRRGYTLVELALGLLLAVLIFGGAMGALIYTVRGFRREDLQMTRGRVAQRILDRIDDDVTHLDGVATVTTAAIELTGYGHEPIEFLLEPRRAAHILNCYTVGKVEPDYSKLLPFEERWMRLPVGIGLDKPRCHYLETDPRPQYDIFPAFGFSSVIEVRKPADDPAVVYVAMSLGRGIDPPQDVLWAFFRKPGQKHPAGAVLRWSLPNGLEDLTREARLVGDAGLRDQWLHVTTPSGRTGAEVFEVLLDIDLEAPPDTTLPMVSPPFRTRRTMTAGL